MVYFVVYLMFLAAYKCQSVYACVCDYTDIHGIRFLKRAFLTGLRVSRSAGTVTVGYTRWLLRVKDGVGSHPEALLYL